MFKGWSKFEKIWIVIFSALILGTTVVSNVMAKVPLSLTSTSLLNWIVAPLSALTGIICVVLVAKGKISNYGWGLINVVTYAYIAWKAGYYGDFVLNAFFFLPFQFIGYYVWKKRLKDGSNSDVKVRKLTLKQTLLLTIVGIIIIIAFGWVLNKVDLWVITVLKKSDPSIYKCLTDLTGLSFFGPVFDASTEVFQILAQLLMTWAFREQWALWLINNIITISMWVVVAIAIPAMAPMAMVMVVMWTGYLINSCYGWHKWNQEVKES